MTARTQPLVPVMKRFSKGFPKWAGESAVIEYVPLGDALSKPFGYDMHTALYSVPEFLRRLARGKFSPDDFLAIIKSKCPAGIPMTWIAFDVDKHSGTPGELEEWRVGERAKVDALFEAHPGGYYYSTSKGYRIGYLIPTRYISTPEEHAAQYDWYKANLSYLSRRFGIEGDSRCGYVLWVLRGPFVTRDGVPQHPETRGDAYNLGLWDAALEPSDYPVRKSVTGEPPRRLDDYEEPADVWEAIGQIDQAEAILKLSGRPEVGGREFDWGSDGKLIIDGKSVNIWIDSDDGHIGSLNESGPTVYRFLRHNVEKGRCKATPGETLELLMDIYPHLREVDERCKAETAELVRGIGQSTYVSVADSARAVSTSGESNTDRAQRETLLLGKLLLNEKKKAINCSTNVNTLLTCLFPGQFRFNLLTKSVEASDCHGGKFARAAAADNLPGVLADYLSRDIRDFRDDVKIVTDAGKVASALITVAREHDFNPLQDYLRGLAWDGTPRLDTWLETYAKAATVDEDEEDVSGYVRTVGARWLISAVARALYPGCKADCVLVFYSPEQGLFKSTVFDIIGGKWFNDTPVMIGQKDGNIAVGSSWIHELGELDSIRKSESEAQKTFLSSRVDKIRMPYGRTQQEFPRMCVFGGTTNAREFLTDRTGNRRFWSVRVEGRADIRALRRDRNQLLAEAVHRLHNAPKPELCRGEDHEQGPGERWWLEPDEQKIADAMAHKRMSEGVVESYAEKIETWLDKAPGNGGPSDAARKEGFTITEIASGVLEIPVERQHARVKGEIGFALRSLEYRQHGKIRPRRWVKNDLPKPAAEQVDEDASLVLAKITAVKR